MRKLAIVCGAKSSDYLAPYDTHEIWILANQCQRHEGKSISRVFELHDNLSEHDDGYADYIQGLKVPLVVGENSTLDGEVFPYSECRDLIGRDYFTSSPACMLAYAILRGYTDISIYGVDMAIDDHEYFMQRPCMEGWLGFAIGRGIKVTIPEQSSLMNFKYCEGRDWNGVDKDFGNKPFTEQEFQGVAEIHQREINECRAQIEALNHKISAHDGARQAYIRMSKVARSIEAGNQVNSLVESAVINGKN